MNILCLSDIHLKKLDSIETKRLMISIKDSMINHKKIDACFVTGDFTETGSDDEYDIFLSVMKKSLPKDTKVYVSIGNHENLRESSIPSHKFKDVFGYNINDTFDLNGYKIITLGTKRDEVFHQEDLFWLKNALHDASLTDLNKPIFLLEHYPPFKDVPYSSMQGQESLYNILEPYHRLIHVSGHTHPNLKDSRVISIHPFVSFNNGSMSWQIYKDDLYVQKSERLAVGQYAVIHIQNDENIFIYCYEIDDEKQLSNLLKPPVHIHFSSLSK